MHLTKDTINIPLENVAQHSHLFGNVYLSWKNQTGTEIHSNNSQHPRPSIHAIQNRML